MKDQKLSTMSDIKPTLLTLRFVMIFSLATLTFGCVVKEELDSTYNQAHLGLNEWSLIQDETGSYKLSFDAGYLIGLVDEEGIQQINWTFELVNRDREIISYSSEQMREPSPEKTAIFVEGKRTRDVELMTLLNGGETYILWFTLKYRDDILHEQLFPLVAGESGGDPNWIQDLIGEDIDDLSNLSNTGQIGAGDSGMSDAVEEEASEEPVDLIPLPEEG